MIKFRQQAQAPRQAHVRIQGATPFTEIYVVNSRFHRVASFLGKGNINLPSGTYTFRFQEGNNIRDQLVYVDQDMEVRDKKHDQQPELVAVADVPSREHRWDLNALLRDERPAPGRANPLQARVHPGNAEVICCELELQLPNEVSWRLPLIMRRDWQVSVTLPGNQRLDQLLIHMEREGHGAREHSMEFGTPFNLRELSRLALQALDNGRAIVAKNALRYLVNNKWELPWHGVIALHLQTLRPDPDKDLIRTMLNNLQHLYGISNHPDLVAAQWWFRLHADDPITPAEPVTLAPTLSNSWRLLLEADAAFPGQVLAPSLVKDIEPKLASFGPLLLQGTSSQLLQRRQVLEQQIRSAALDALQSRPALAKTVFDSDSGHLLPQVLADLAYQAAAGPVDAFPVTRLVVSIENTSLPGGSHSSAAAAIAEVLETTEIRRKIQLATGHSLTALEQLKGDPVLA